MKPGSAYYAGGARVVIDGVPIRLARPISAWNLANLRAWEKERNREMWHDEPKERAKYRVAQANRTIQIYADMLGIDVKQAKAVIERQRLHVLSNPLVDISLEYDL